MLRSLATLILLAVVYSGSAQIYNPVKWSFGYRLDGDEHAVLEFTATIEEGWHVYATKLESDMGPIPTEIVFGEIKGAGLDPLPKKTPLQQQRQRDRVLVWC